MIQFDFNRFGKLARWSLVNDKSYYVRTFLQMVAVLTLAFPVLYNGRKWHREV